MKKIGLVFITVFLTVSGFAQRTADIGIWGGSSTYWGDIQDAPPLQTFNLNIGAFFRYNFNARVALRTMFITGNHSAEGMVQDEIWGFSKSASDISVMMEINYLKYIIGDKKTAFTPYIMAGLGVMYFPYTLTAQDMGRLSIINPGNPLVTGGANMDEPVIAPAIPFGFGIKFMLGERLGIGAEYQLRKLMNDKLDNLDDPLAFDEGGQIYKYTDFWHNNDWPGFLGLHITYNINLEQRACPAYDRKYW
jgi:hypothetical protein